MPINETIVVEIGEPPRDLAKIYGVSVGTISRFAQ